MRPDEGSPPGPSSPAGPGPVCESGPFGVTRTLTGTPETFLERNPVFKEKVCLALLTVFLYTVLYLSFGEEFLPSGAAWATFLIWLASHVGGNCVAYVGLPPLLGMLLSGIVLRNLPGELVEGLPDAWSSSIRAAGLSIILTRSGLELDLEAFRRIGLMAVRLTAMPGVSEAVVVGGASVLIFGMPPALGIALGFILGAVSPAVVVLGMFELQSKGYGVDKGIPSLVVAAASFDDVLAISGFSIASGLTLGHGGSLAWEVSHGPLNLIAGVLGGVLAGCICSLTQLWDSRLKRTGVVLVLAQLLMFLGYKFHFTGAGAMGGLVMAITAAKLWASGSPSSFSIGPMPTAAHVCEGDLAIVWSTLGQPLLFGVIGSAVDFNELDGTTIPKAILAILIGLAIRLPMAYIACCGGNMTFWEKLFISLSWMPKATVQAALASVPLDLIKENKHEESDYEDWLKWGNDILTTSVFSIILTAPLGMIIINSLGPRWLEQNASRVAGAHAHAVIGDVDNHYKADGEVKGEGDREMGEVGGQDPLANAEDGKPPARTTNTSAAGSDHFDGAVTAASGPCGDGVLASVKRRSGRRLSAAEVQFVEPPQDPQTLRSALDDHVRTLTSIQTSDPDVAAALRSQAAVIQTLVKVQLPYRTGAMPVETVGNFFSEQRRASQLSGAGTSDEPRSARTSRDEERSARTMSR
mmetsp:Transcript_18133/g.59223  ORF Transcript_18133/g.59223 Transcript_18133/m.59223 type:complete len:695 (+) Transcript_18133:796-2880(+)